MPSEELAPIAEAKDSADPPRTPLRLMTQFLRAVSESRMEDALALAQTILTFEPRNPIILEYQSTLAQYINNERELAAREGDDDDDATDDSSTGEDLSSNSTDASTEEVSDDNTPSDRSQGAEREATAASTSDLSARGNIEEVSRQEPTSDEQELQRLRRMFQALRERRAGESRVMASRWDEEKFAASRREVEEILWRFLPEEAKEAAEKKRGQSVHNWACHRK